MNKVLLFTRSLNSLGTINFLMSKNMLSAVAVPNVNDMETHTLLQTLNQYKIPYFIYGEEEKQNLQNIKKIEPTLGIVFGFPFKIPSSIIEYFKDEIYNYHGSLLPKYRGVDPIFWQLKNGESKSALTLHKLTQNFDDGDIVLQEEFELKAHYTQGVLNAIFSEISLNLTARFLEKLETKTLSTSAQIGDISCAPKVKEEDLIIDWDSMNSQDIYNLCRACNPIFGGAKTIWKNSFISILEATVVDMENLGLKPGTIIHIGSPEGLIVSTKDGTLKIDIVSVPDGVFNGLRFAKCFNIEVGELLKKN